MDIQEKIFELSKNNISFAVATVVKTSGSTPGKVGFKMIVESSGSTIGTVGGGGIEVEAIAESLKRLQTNESSLVEYILSDKTMEEPVEANVIKMSCNGKAWIFYEVFNSRPAIYVFGGGHVGQALLSILANLPFRTVLIDNRPEFASETVNKNADTIICEDYINYTQKFNPESNSYIVILTHKHIYDYDILKTIFERKLQVPYIGVIGSKSKAKGVKEQLPKDLGYIPDISNLHIPIGFDLGGDTAYEIAIAIAAQIQAVYYNKLA
ncbi:MAG: XdhC/CoxI family protein [Bacteroidota bacterium]|nr:XdhC/CoxI family protein [Bacteroidota bacterium]